MKLWFKNVFFVFCEKENDWGSGVGKHTSRFFPCMISLTEESGPSHDMRTEESEPPPRLVVGAVALGEASLSFWGRVKKVVSFVVGLLEK